MCDCSVQGIVRALREYQQKLIEGNVSIFVRRAGPNYQEGLRVMRELGKTLVVNLVCEYTNIKYCDFIVFFVCVFVTLVKTLLVYPLDG